MPYDGHVEVTIGIPGVEKTELSALMLVVPLTKECLCYLELMPSVTLGLKGRVQWKPLP